ncbi:MAG TPA: restriction endonuclease subunit S [Dehalococcoidia bacterium]|nr:restriction endonuclease subunit S [Dehalococcoidia bacterium]
MTVDAGSAERTTSRHAGRDGAVPDGWRIAPLGELATIVMGQSPPSSRVNETGEGQPFIQGNAEFGFRHPTPVKWCISPPKEALPGDILVSVRAPVGELNIADRPLAIGRGLAAIRFDGADRSFGWYVLHLAIRQATRVSQGSTFLAIGSRELRALPVLVPPLPEQRKIAEILSAVDDAIEKTEAVIEQVRRVKQGLAQQLLTRGLPGRHTHFKQTEVGEIPACWEVVRLGQIIHRCQYGLSAPLISEPVGVPVLRMNNLAGGGIDTTDLKYVVLSENDRKVYGLRPGDLLFNRTNSQDLVGKVSLFNLKSEMAFASYLLRLQVVEERALPTWLNHYLNLPGVQATFRRLATPGVSQSNVNARALLKTLVPLPPIDEQRAVVETVGSFERRMGGETESLAAFRALKSALMHALLTGQVRVRVEPVNWSKEVDHVG